MVSRFLRLLPSFKGKARLARLLLKNKGVSHNNQLIEGDYGIRYNLPNTKESIGFFLLINGIYEKDVSSFIIKHLPKSGTFLDIGINIGTISLPLAKLRKDCSIIGIEAAIDVFDCLLQNIALNKLGNITPINKAVSENDGDLISFYSPDEQFGKGSMSPVFTKDAKSVETITLDKLAKDFNLARIDLIKIDVEGYECNVFKGGKDVLSAPTAPDIIFEFVDWAEGLAQNTEVGDAQKILKEYGYVLYDFDNLSKGPIGLTTKGSMNIFASKKHPINFQ